MSYIRLSLVGAFIFFAATAISAQREQTIAGGRGFGLSGIWGGSNFQMANFNNTRSYVKGGFIGLEFGKSLFVGYSHFKLQDEFDWDGLVNQDFELKWSGAKLGYGFQNFRALHPMINVDLGPGRVELGQDDDRILVIQPSAGLEVNVFRFCRLGLEGGYRFVQDAKLENLTNANTALSGPFAQATLKFGWSWGRYHQKRKTTTSAND